MAKERGFSDPDSWEGKLQRAEIGLNFGLSVFGSFLYLVGSILFIPSLNSLGYVGSDSFVYCLSVSLSAVCLLCVCCIYDGFS